MRGDRADLEPRTDAVDLRGAAEEVEARDPPNESGIVWEIYYGPTAPMWELLPIDVRSKNGKLLADMYHMKEPGKWTGWVEIEGERLGRRLPRRA